MSPRDIENNVDDANNATTQNGDGMNDDGEKRFGPCMVILLIIALPLNYFFSLLAFACTVIVMFISGNIIRGCCCSAKQYDFEPHVRKWAKVVMTNVAVYNVSWLLLTFYYDVGFLPRKPGSGGGAGPSWDDEDFSMTQTVVTVLSYLFLIVALLFAGLFTWGKNWKHLVT